MKEKFRNVYFAKPYWLFEMLYRIYLPITWSLKEMTWYLENTFQKKIEMTCKFAPTLPQMKELISNESPNFVFVCLCHVLNPQDDVTLHWNLDDPTDGNASPQVPIGYSCKGKYSNWLRVNWNFCCHWQLFLNVLGWSTYKSSLILSSLYFNIIFNYKNLVVPLFCFQCCWIFQ